MSEVGERSSKRRIPIMYHAQNKALCPSLCVILIVNPHNAIIEGQIARIMNTKRRLNVGNLQQLWMEIGGV